MLAKSFCHDCGARRENPDADLKNKLRFIYKQKRHKARTKDAAEPDIKNF